MGYGVLRGSVDRWVREDGESTPHLQIRVLDEAGQPWRIAVNVQSDTGVRRRVLGGRPVRRASDAGVAAPHAVRVHHGRAGNADDALDYVKAPLFDWTLGRRCRQRQRQRPTTCRTCCRCTSTSARTPAARSYAFGAKFDRNLHKPIDTEFGNTDGLHGIHDIHLNQGNVGRTRRRQRRVSRWRPASSRFPIGRRAVPRLPDPARPDRRGGPPNTGLPADCRSDRRRGAPDPAPDPSPTPTPSPTPAPAPSPAPSPASVSTLYLERALLNPTGDDVGREVVVIGNLANVAVSLEGWQLVDKNRRSTTVGQDVGSGLGRRPGRVAARVFS